MASAATKALGTTISIDATPIGSLSSIGGVEITADEIDATNHDSALGFRERITGLLDTGALEISGQYVNADTGQAALMTASGASTGTPTAAAFIITYPDFSTISFDAVITRIVPVGEATVDGLLTFSATLRPTGAVSDPFGA